MKQTRRLFTFIVPIIYLSAVQISHCSNSEPSDTVNTTTQGSDIVTSTSQQIDLEDTSNQQNKSNDYVPRTSSLEDAIQTLSKQQQLTAVRNNIVASILAKSTPVIRPSLEEKASELSKKYLNLEHDNWRLKQQQQQQQQLQLQSIGTEVASSVPVFGEDANGARVLHDSRAASVSSDNLKQVASITRIEESTVSSTSETPPQTSSTIGATFLPIANSTSEQDIHLESDRQSSSVLLYDDEYNSSSSGLASENHYTSAKTTALPRDATMTGPGLPTTDASSTPATASAATNVRSTRTRGRSSKQTSVVDRTSKRRQFKGLMNATLNTDELHQCQRYLQQYSSSKRRSPSSEVSGGHLSGSFYANVAGIGSSELVSGEQQQLPCSCELRLAPTYHTKPSRSPELVSWLSCDNVQLYTGHLFTPATGAVSEIALNGSQLKQKSTESDSLASMVLVRRFSQRDSALQTLQSQKFHNLQLLELTWVDLSHNRIRQIQIDAFHGLETKLERLDLSNNLLGDSRLMLNDLAASFVVDSGTKRHNKLTFSIEELSKLRKLKWLSIRNNHIRQLSPNTFFKPTTDNQISELNHIDLSHNLLQYVPSEAIKHLQNLKSINLNNNRIIQLNRDSKFPRSLSQLYLSSNLINEIDGCNVIDLPQLVELDLSDNQLSRLELNAFVLGATPVVEDVAVRSVQSGLVDNDFERSLNHILASGEKIFSPVEHRMKRDTDEANTDEAPVSEVPSLESVEFNGVLDDEGDLMASESEERRKQVNRPPTAPVQTQPPGTSLSLRLNLSMNYFETFPGDSLLKFVNLQELDLSNNRIRVLDANYLCSIFNLVDNLRSLDLSGNLLTMADSSTVAYKTASRTQDQAAPADKLAEVIERRSLNRLFGCLQRLESLHLSKNRLSVVLPPASMWSSLKASDGSGNDPANDPMMAFGAPVYDRSSGSGDEDELEASDNGDQLLSDSSIQGSIVDSERLILKFTENSGGRSLKHLDLSDNHLKLMPIIKQLTQPPSLMTPTLSLNDSTGGNKTVTSGGDATLPALDTIKQQVELNHWINSRIFLETLDLSYNYLERVEEHDFEHLFNLRELHLSFNKLTHLPVKVMRRFTSLDRLSLDGNQLSSIEPLNELIELSTKTLRNLDLSHNRLLEWPQLSIGQTNGNVLQSGLAAEGKQTTMPNFALEQLNLEDNLLTSHNVTALFDQLIYMKSLRVLNLNFNLINRIRSEWFKYANKNLRRLSLTGNKINNIDLGAFAADQVNELVQLDLNHNLLKELKRRTFDVMPKMRHLDLSHNMIHTINSETFNQLSSLQVLRLNHNRLTSWKCEYFTQLCNSITGNINTDLNALMSPLSSIDWDGLNLNERYNLVEEDISVGTTASSLIELDLSHNSISQLRANSISVHTKLIRLNLEHNKLSYLPHDLFKATTSTLTSTGGGKQISLIASLKYINLSHNRIQTIENINLKPLRNLVALDLSHNELQNIGLDVVVPGGGNQNGAFQHKNIFINANDNNNNTNQSNQSDILAEEDLASPLSANKNRTSARPLSKLLPSSNSWPALCHLRRLNLAHNLLKTVNQSILSDLSPFVALSLNLSANNLETESLPNGFCTKIAAAHNANQHKLSTSPSGSSAQPTQPGIVGLGQAADESTKLSYDLIFTLKIESIDLSHNRLNELPTKLLDNHYTSLEACNLSHNRIQSLPPNSNSIIQIKSLDLQYNPLDCASSELLLFEKKNARYLNLAATRLFAIHQATEAAELAVHSKHRRVNHSSTNLDSIRSISQIIDAPYLRHLNLSSNQLVWLAANIFEKLHSLRTLDLSHNQLTRLHLLNNQLTPMATSLEFIDLSSNLFTEIGVNDLTHLSGLRHLDLSNLLSLSKLDCRFLARLTTLKLIRMFNFPQMRQNIQSLIAALHTIGSNPRISGRIKQKIKGELIFSTIGSHCFQVPKVKPLEQDGSEAEDLDRTRKAPLVASDLGLETKWFNLEQVELELFNSFDRQLLDSYQVSGKLPGKGSFRLRSELGHLLGPKTRKLTLIGLNLTRLSEESLLGVASNEIDLKISYTSLNQIPLSQILTSLTKATQLHLDLRHNNIQSIDVSNIVWLDELHQSRRAHATTMLSSLGAPAINSRPLIRLDSNPFRCDCQTRPLWLWLNQRWSAPVNIDAGIPAEDLASLGDNFSFQGGQWNRFSNQLGQTSDVKCYHPLKLRGKLVYHVNYNDLICSRGGSPSVMPMASTLKRKTNDTRSSDSYYLTSINADSIDPYDDINGGEAIDEQSEISDAALRSNESIVRVTKFNRYPATLFNMSILYTLYDFAERLGSQSRDTRNETISIDRDEDLIVSELELLSHEKTGKASASDELMSAPMSTNYSKHRPNTRQKHTPLGPSDSHSPTGKSMRPTPDSPVQASSSASGRHHPTQTFLTDSDVIMLTGISIAMIVMFFVIMTICLFKYKFDKSVEEQILADSRGKFFVDVPHGIILGKAPPGGSSSSALNRREWNKKIVKSRSTNKAITRRQLRKKRTGLNSETSLQSSPSGSSQSVLCSSSSTSKQSSAKSRSRDQKAEDKVVLASGCKIGKSSSSRSAKLNRKQLQHYASQPALIPFEATNLASISQKFARTNTNANFLMRSPTIRRMQGLATNASDWFKYTLRAYPTPARSVCARESYQRRRLFLRNNIVTQGSSQLTTSELANQFNLVTKTQLPVAIAQGCPLHEFRCLSGPIVSPRARAENGAEVSQCLYCNRLLDVIQQTQARHAAASALKRPTKLEQVTLPAPSKVSGSCQESEIIALGRTQTSASNNYSSEPGAGRPGDRCVTTVKTTHLPNDSSTIENTRSTNDHLNPTLTGPILPDQVNHRYLNQQQNQQQTDSNTCADTSEQSDWVRRQHYQQRARPMRTFRSTNPRPASSGTLAESIASGFSMQCHGDQINADGYSPVNGTSQLPTTGLCGRFAYQLDSQSESGCNNAKSPYVSQTNLHYEQDTSTIISSTAPDKSTGILVLARDTPLCAAGSTSAETCNGVLSNQRANNETLNLRSEFNSAQVDTASSVVHADECSRTSSPVAYGFMRSSPSVTTNVSTSGTPVTAAAPVFQSTCSPGPISMNKGSNRPVQRETENKVIQLRSAFENRCLEVASGPRNVASENTTESTCVNRRNNNEIKLDNRRHKVSERKDSADSDGGGGGCTSDSSGDRVIVSRL